MRHRNGSVLVERVVLSRLATFPEGSGVATDGDVSAHPAAWRTEELGAWRETAPPRSAFLTHGAVLSDRLGW